MSAPRTKRQFAGAASDPAQRQITSYLKASPSGTTNPSEPSTSLLSPTLPALVQANLLSVGMRVRKSVPEGYKTGQSCSGFPLWSDTPASPAQSPAQGTFQLPTTTAPEGSILSSRRELLPFCGIHKVGGLGVQPDSPPTGIVTAAANPPPQPSFSISSPSFPVPGLHDLPSLTSSQDSILSTTSSPPLPHLSLPNKPSKKRLYTEDTSPVSALSLPDAVPDPIIWRDRRDWLEGEVSPRSLAPAGWEKNTRVMAVPRGARKVARHAPGTAADGGGGAGARLLRDLGQENMLVDVVAAARADDDFEEAEFLDQGLGVGEMEVESE